jgi:hypothetical protein
LEDGNDLNSFTVRLLDSSVFFVSSFFGKESSDELSSRVIDKRSSFSLSFVSLMDFSFFISQ